MVEPWAEEFSTVDGEDRGLTSVGEEFEWVHLEGIHQGGNLLACCCIITREVCYDVDLVQLGAIMDPSYTEEEDLCC